MKEVYVYNKCHGGSTLIDSDVWTEGSEEKAGNDNHMLRLSMMKLLDSNSYHKSNR